MNQKKAKALRKTVYGDMASVSREYSTATNHRKRIAVSGKNGANKRNVVVVVSGSIRNSPNSVRAVYQTAKRKATIAP